MDPNVTLETLRDLLDRYEVDESVVPEIVETFHGLDEWLTGGGFLPAEWDRPSALPRLGDPESPLAVEAPTPPPIEDDTRRAVGPLPEFDDDTPGRKLIRLDAREEES
jgi:hypothetical protein